MTRQPAPGEEMVWNSPSESITRDAPERLTDVASWHSHIPFAFWCIEQLRPRVFVELGTHRGDSYCAFCQAVSRLSLPTACYAIDTWRGEHQAGFYDEEVLEDLRSYHDPRYGGFSRLVRSTFDDAVSHFSDGTIDLLHIDGLHTYEAVRHDFETWLPKLSRSAVVLFHDTNVRELDFGVWRYWEELSARHPHFTFLHGHGLGVLVVGPDAPEAAKRLAACDPGEATRVRAFFAQHGHAVQASGERRRLGPSPAERLAQAEETLAAHEARVQELGTELAELRLKLETVSRDLEKALVDLEQALVEVRRPRPLDRLLESATRLPRRLRHAADVALHVLYWAATFQLRAGLRLRKYARLIRRSGLFDTEFYLAQCRDDPEAAKDPIGHYLLRGAAAGLDPNPLFGTTAYVERNPAAAARGKNPLVHFIRSGGARAGGAAAEGGARFPPWVAPSAPSGTSLLALHPFRPPPNVPGEAGRHVFVVDHRVPTPDHDSGSVRMFAIVKLLGQLGYAVTFASDGECNEARHEEALRSLGAEIVCGYSAALAHLAAEGHRYRWALLSRPEQALRYLAAVRGYAPHATVIYDTVDLHWARMQRQAEVTGSAAAREEAERFRRMERIACTCSDLVFTVTPQEKDAVLAEVPGARVEVVPNVHTCDPASLPWSERKDLMFIGGFEHAPNVDAVRWFVERILPIVQAELPGTVFHVVGSKPTPEVERLASPTVRIAGYVPDPQPYFERCRVFVSPLRYGAGMKGKIGQSMGFGLPVVTTTVGAEGLLLVDGENALVADTPEDFARAIVRLYSDPLLWAKLSRSSARHVQEHFSPEVTRARLESIFSSSHAAPADARLAEPGSAA